MSDLLFFSLTPEENENTYTLMEDEDSMTNWLEDSECQENLFNIMQLTPEESIVDSDNHIQTSFKLFFEELGYLTEEPEPIDPNRDYDAEAKLLLEERNKNTRKQHINIPSLDSDSSSSSSINHDLTVDFIRSPYYLGTTNHSKPNHFISSYNYQRSNNRIY